MNFSSLGGLDAEITLTACKAIFSGNGRYDLLPVERATLEAMQTHLLGTEIDLHALSPRTPGRDDLEAFRQRNDDGLLEAVSALWCILPIVDGELTVAKVSVLGELLSALDRNTALARDLAALAERERFAPKLRIFRRIFVRIFHIGLLRGLGQLAVAYLGLRDRAIGRRYDALARLPKHTFGYQLWDFYHQNGMKAPGRFGAYPYEQIGPHDAHHVLSASDTSYEGEFLVLPFECGSSEARSADFLVAMMLQTQAGMVLDRSVPATTGRFNPDAFFYELARGTRVREDLLAKDWDFWPYVDRPIAEVRADIGIGPGGNVDWDRPQWNGKEQEIV